MPTHNATPSFSVVLNTYNRAAVVPHALESVLAQTFSDFEVVVVDDGSTDETAETIAEFDDPRVRYVRRTNGGLAKARNTGIEAARGRFIVFLDDDDLVLDSWLERMAEKIEKDHTGIVSCGAEIRSPDGSATVAKLPTHLGPVFENQVGMFIPGTFCVRRDVLDEIGGFMESLRCSEQTELSLRAVPYCAQRGLGVESIAEALVVTNREAEERRPLRRADWIHDGALAVLERHGDRLRRSPRTYAHFKGIAAVQGARMGRYAEARRLLVEAIRADPSNLKHYARLGVASLPLLRTRVWGRWEAPKRSTSPQPATAPRVGSDSKLRALARHVPGASALKQRFFPTPWPPKRLPLLAPPREPGWVTGPPDFVGIGAQRSGTSWWSALISEHPGVHVNSGIPKELHFFDTFHQGEWNVQDRDAYLELFPRPAGMLAGEWTPEYMLFPWCAPLLARCGVERLIVCLRDPVDRYRSGWAFSVRRGAPAVPTIAGDAFVRGLYHRQLRWVLEHFDRSQILVLQYEACLADPLAQIRRTYEFLGLDPAFTPSMPDARVKTAYAKSGLDPAFAQTLVAAYREDVLALFASFSELDPELWPNFA
jgi:glycosyltransferase involved in cell wall biosynthesis